MIMGSKHSKEVADCKRTPDETFTPRGGGGSYYNEVNDAQSTPGLGASYCSEVEIGSGYGSNTEGQADECESLITAEYTTLTRTSQSQSVSFCQSPAGGNEFTDRGGTSHSELYITSRAGTATITPQSVRGNRSTVSLHVIRGPPTAYLA